MKNPPRRMCAGEGSVAVERAVKERLVDTLRATFDGANAIVVTHYLGITAGEATDLRRQMRAAGATFRVTKNSLARRALEGTPYGHMTGLFTGPTAIAWSEDPVAAAKASVEFAKQNRHLVILGGGLRETALDEAAVRDLANLPSLDVLRARLVGVISAPATRVAGVLQAPAGQLARVFNAYAEAA